MKMFIFQSGAKPELHAFAGDSDGRTLPTKFAPWGVTGIVTAAQALPHGLPRNVIEREIRAHGFQLWRLKKTSPQPMSSDRKRGRRAGIRA
jgi:hypothetical protein